MSRDATAPLPAAPAPEAPWHEPVAVSNRTSLASLAAVLAVSTARQARGKRLWAIILLFAAPAVIALLVRRYDLSYEPADGEKVLVFGLIPQAVVPLAALLFASGLVRDDVEEQTLTYLLIRPAPRWAIYLVKALGTALLLSALAAVFTTAALAAVHVGLSGRGWTWLAARAGVVVGLSSLALLVYVAVFGCLGLITRRSLALGVAYVLIFEGFLANVPFVVRYGTVMFYNRVAAVRWLGLEADEWRIDLDAAPSAATCVEVQLAAAALFIALGAWIFSTREFRVKTSEGG